MAIVLSGSLILSGSLEATGGVTISGSIASASFATSGSYSLNALTSSNAMTASSADTFYVRNNVTALGSITAQTLIVQTITSSVLFTTGSNKIGSSLSNVQELTGSVGITGSLAINGTTAVVGSGTANYVPKFTSSSAIGNSAITDDGTTVTLVSRALSGTSATFSGNITASGTGNVTIQAASSTNFPLFQLLDTRAGGTTWNIEGGRTLGNLQIRSSVAGATVFEIAGAGAATFSSSVAIGGATTVGKLDVKTATANIPALGTLGNGFNMVRADGILGMSIGWENAVGSWYWQGQRTDSSVALNLALQPLGGNVGIGTTSPSSFANYTNLSIKGGTSGINLDFFTSAGTRTTAIISDSSAFYIQNLTAIPLIFTTNNTERMRIPSTGGLLIGTTTGTGLTTGSSVNVGVEISGGIIALQVNNNSNQYWSKASGYTSGDFTAHFVNGTYVGGISTNGSTTNYATASDYRLKEDLKDFVGIDLINRIKTYDYQWKSDKTRMYGVVAHEFAEVLSYAVTGQKDEERMQGVDYSKIVPVLVKAIQELSAKNTSLEERLLALENAQ